MTVRQASTISRFRWLAVIASIVAAVWTVEEHFVTRREFAELSSDVSQLRQDVSAIRFSMERTERK